MNYSTKTRTELQTLRNRFLAALTSNRLNATNRVSIEGWISQIEAELIKQAPVAKPVTKVSMMTEQEKWNCWS
ncbi:MAG: hypothetical protein ACR2OE_01260 [Thermomicrobiales bacterium]